MKARFAINPFYKIAGFKSFLIALPFVALTIYLAQVTGTHQLGLLKFRLAKDSDFTIFMAEVLINWVLLTGFFYLSGILLSKSNIRLIDILGTTLLSRLPLIIVPTIRLLLPFRSFINQSWQLSFITTLYIASITWVIVLLYNAYRLSVNLKGSSLYFSFIVSFLLAEVFSQIIITLYL